MVTIFRHFYKEVNFIVPDYAYSAGTILCMSGDNIYMNYYSVLGPIDPQVRNKDGKFVAALGYLDKINELLQKAKDNTITQAEFLILRDFDLAELRSYEQSKELAIDMLKIWLTKYKFKDWTTHSDTGIQVTDMERNKRAIEIAEKLSNNNIWKSHSRPIDAETLRNELHLKINDLADDVEINDLIDKYYKCLCEYVMRHKYTVFSKQDYLFERGCFFMKKMFEQIEELLLDMEPTLYNKHLAKALYDYHNMISEGKLIPRGNTLSSLQNNIFSYNTSNTNMP